MHGPKTIDPLIQFTKEVQIVTNKKAVTLDYRTLQPMQWQLPSEIRSPKNQSVLQGILETQQQKIKNEIHHEENQSKECITHPVHVQWVVHP